LFFPVDRMPLGLRVVASLLPTTHAVTLMRGAYEGAGWSAQWGSAAALLAIFAVCLVLATRWFRWE
jgi:ABC-type multidrug transport system permease subunit